MRFGVWWKRSSGWAKTITVLAAALLLQIGVCALTPGSVDWMRILTGQHAENDPFANLGALLIEAGLSLLTLFIMVGVWLTTPSRPDRREPDSSEDT